MRAAVQLVCWVPQRSCLGNKTEASMSNDLSGYTLVMPQRSCLGNKTEALSCGEAHGCLGFASTKLPR